jgi:hypothetical protein
MLLYFGYYRFMNEFGIMREVVSDLKAKKLIEIDNRMIEAENAKHEELEVISETAKKATKAKKK